MRLRGLVSSRLGGVSKGLCSKIFVFGDLRLGLVDGLVGDDQGLEGVAGVVDGLDELGGQQGLGDLWALAHDGGPDGELGVVAGHGQGEVVAVVAQALHHVLVDDGEDEAVKGAVGHLLGVGLAVDGGDLGLLAVEDVRGGLEALLRGRPAVEEERQDGLSNLQHGVEALGKGELEVDEGSVLAAGGVGRVLVSLLLAHDILELRGLGQGASEVVLPNAARAGGRLEVADLDELLLQDWHVGLCPAARLAAVLLGAPDVEGDDGEQERQDVHLYAEVLERGALPHAVPLGVRELAAVEACRRGGHGRGRQRRGMVDWDRVGRARIVSEVCAAGQ
jgi:hypothetical protein